MLLFSQLTDSPLQMHWSNSAFFVFTAVNVKVVT